MKNRNEKKELGIILDYPAHFATTKTKVKLYIKYGTSRAVTDGFITDIHHGVKMGNIEKLLAKRNVGNIAKIIARVDTRKDFKRDENTFVLYKSEGVK